MKGGLHRRLMPFDPTSDTLRPNGGSGTSSTKTRLVSSEEPKAFQAVQVNVPESGRVVVGAVSSDTRPESVSFVEMENLANGKIVRREGEEIEENER